MALQGEGATLGALVALLRHTSTGDLLVALPSSWLPATQRPASTVQLPASWVNFPELCPCPGVLTATSLSIHWITRRLHLSIALETQAKLRVAIVPLPIVVQLSTLKRGKTCWDDAASGAPLPRARHWPTVLSRPCDPPNILVFIFWRLGPRLPVAGGFTGLVGIR